MDAFCLLISKMILASLPFDLFLFQGDDVGNQRLMMKIDLMRFVTRRQRQILQMIPKLTHPISEVRIKTTGAALEKSINGFITSLKTSILS